MHKWVSITIFYYLALIFFSAKKKVIANSGRGKYYALSNDPTICVPTESSRRQLGTEGDVRWGVNQVKQGDGRNGES